MAVKNLVDFLNGKRETFVFSVEQEWVEYSEGTPQLRIFEKILDRERFEKGELAIVFNKRHGITYAEKTSLGDIYSRFNELETKYNKALQNLSRLHGVSSYDIQQVLDVELISAKEKEELGKESAGIDESDTDDQKQEKAIDLIVRLNKKMEQFAKSGQTRHLRIISDIQLESFKMLTELYEELLEARTDYYTALCGLMLTTEKRIPDLDENIKDFELLDDTKALHAGFIQQLFIDFVQRELRGKTGWDEPKEPKTDVPDSEEGKEPSSPPSPKKSNTLTKTPLTGS